MPCEHKEGYQVRDWAPVAVGEGNWDLVRGRRRSCFGGGGEQARCRQLEPPFTCFGQASEQGSGAQGGPGLAASFAQRNGKPRQALRMYAHVPPSLDVDVWM